MPPRLRLPTRRPSIQLVASCHRCRYASVTSASTATSASAGVAIQNPQLAQSYPTTQPPSHKPPEFRKSQLLRQYASLLYSTPLMLIFQHNNVRSVEWVAIRRELARALQRVDQELIAKGHTDAKGAENIKINTIQTGIFAAALDVVEFYRPESRQRSSTSSHDESSSPPQGAPIAGINSAVELDLTHVLSRSTYKAVQRQKRNKKHGLEPLLSGPLAIVSFPTVSPAHVAATLSILSPNPQFAAPKRKANPRYYEADIQLGLQKLLLLGARVEGKVFDDTGIRWVGGIEGGLDGLRAQLVAMLQSFGAGITTTLDTSAKSLWLTVESRRSMLEEEQDKDTQKTG